METQAKNPDIDQTFREAVLHHEAGRLPEAEALYRQVLNEQPAHADALHLIGVLAYQSGRHPLAKDLIQRAIDLDPSSPAYHRNLGLVFLAMDQSKAAIPLFRKAVALLPEFAEAWLNLGHTLLQNGQMDDALAAIQRGVELQPDQPEMAMLLAGTLRKHGRTEEAAEQYRKILARWPRHPAAWKDLGTTLAALHAPAEAASAFQRAIELGLDGSDLQTQLGCCLRDCARPEEAIACFDRVLALRPNFACAQSERLYTLHLHSKYDHPEISRQHAIWGKTSSQSNSEIPTPYANNHSPERPIRIGYVFGQRQALANPTILPLLKYHDRAAFEVLCYFTASPDDQWSRAVAEQSIQSRRFANESEEKMASIIREDRIDILIDLSSHGGLAPFGVFARRPAPIAVTFAAYSGTSGLDAMDYRLTDPYLDHPSQANTPSSEKPIQLPHSYWCFDPQSEGMRATQPSTLPALYNRYITFGWFDSFSKINSAVLDLWARVLLAVPDSKMALLSPAGELRMRVVSRFRTAGIDSSRLDFVEVNEPAEQFQQYHRIDIALDTFPFNGHETSLHALWQGVALITLAGDKPVSRAGLSHLCNVGLKHLAAETPESFIQIAASLAADIPSLGQMRGSLAERIQQSPLMDARRFTGNFESALRDIWRQWCAKGSTRH